MHVFLHMQGLTNLQKEERVSPISAITSPFFLKKKTTHCCNQWSSPSLTESPLPTETIDTTPKKLEWNLTPYLRAGVRFAETRLSDLICQNDCQALEFKGYGKNFITSHGFSPDAFVQMAFQAAYFGLYGIYLSFFSFFSLSWKLERLFSFSKGRIECVYEPAMTKAFLHGRTEAIRSVQPQSVNFINVRFFIKKIIISWCVWLTKLVRRSRFSTLKRYLHRKF